MHHGQARQAGRSKTGTAKMMGVEEGGGEGDRSTPPWGARQWGEKEGGQARGEAVERGRK